MFTYFGKYSYLCIVIIKQDIMASIVIRSKFVADDIRKEIREKGVSPMLIDAFNKVCKHTQLYNLQNSTSLADAVIKGLDAHQIHDLVNKYEQFGTKLEEVIEYTYWFIFIKPMKADLLTKAELGRVVSEYAEDIAYRVLENPFGFKDIYTCYVTPMVVQQSEMN